MLYRGTNIKPTVFNAGLVGTLEKGPLTTHRLRVQLQLRTKGLGYWCTGGDYLYARLTRRVKSGLLGVAKSTKWREAGLTCGPVINIYFLKAQLLGAEEEFDLEDPESRKVAADWLEERGGGTELAALLRTCKSVNVGGKLKGAVKTYFEEVANVLEGK